MTDDTTTRTRRRVRARDRGSQSDGAERTRQRSSGDGETQHTTSPGGDGGRVRRRVRKRSVPGAGDVTPTAPDASDMDTTDATQKGGGDADGGGTEHGGTSSAGRRERDGGVPSTGGATGNGAGKDEAEDTGGKGSDAGSGGGTSDTKEDAADARDDDGSDRMSSRKQRDRKGRRRSSGSSPRGGVSEEVRRSVTEGPPRRMLVSVGSQRTEVAVLEERDLVEHYVTRKESESYVGNIYLGRVQNVLPGMEAAFVDIGKGRNGVLYAGEVNYDDEDLESKAPRIEQALKPGQTVVVQVTKDPMGTKGARLTQQLSLAGRFCVLAIEDGTVGISRKLTDAERDRLRETLRDLKPDGYGLIVRTAAAAATDEQLEADVKRLLARWEQVQQRLADAKPLTELYREPELAMRVIRDVYGPEFVELICDDPDLSDQIEEYLNDVTPDLASTLQRYAGDEPLFTAYEITNQVRRALEKKVWLPSGGYLIIEKTEAMWVIDVNTGKFVGDSNLEETVLKNNLEAAEEIARQLRLRDMGGIIVIDFVDMILPANRDEVLKRFKRELARDKTKSRVMEISKLGLVQMTRKNVSQGLTETFTRTCDCCEGRGAQIVDKALKR
ncbi:MAG TPA: Rne/Rng family ribonuclease [Euzebyales bacterium]|nr:Rne/Rng family ribonuclease [Euzebyales bacterium]